MSSGYILINVEPGSESSVFDELSNLPFVSDANHLFGDYDIIVKIEAETIGVIASLVVGSIRAITGVVNTKTLACAEL
jgi:DNA-binding Lrp family transcriptional regulator|tara:strand:- start:450 stop:683 length:234 start_codon:yes stop_codon:yes gene_type:complete